MGQTSLEALVGIGDVALPVLMQDLTFGIPEVRATLLKILGRIGPGALEAIPLLEEIAREDPDDAIRTLSLEVTGNTASILPGLIQSLSSGQEVNPHPANHWRDGASLFHPR